MQKKVYFNWLRFILPLAVLLIAAAVLLTAATGFGIRSAIVVSVPIEDVDLSAPDGVCAQVCVSQIAGIFARSGYITEEEAEEEGVDVDMATCYCMAELPDGRFIAVYVNGKHVPDIERLMSAIEYYGVDEVKSKDYGLLRGTISPLSGEVLDIFRQWADSALPGEPGTQEFYDANILPYILNTDYYGRFPAAVTVALTVAALILVLLAAALLVTGFSGAFDRSVRAEAKRVGAAALGTEFSGAEKLCPGFFAGTEHLWRFGKLSSQVLPLSDIIWLYPRSRRLEGGKLTWYLVGKTKTGGEISAHFGEVEAVKRGEALLSAKIPGVCLGYDADKNAAYKKSPAAFAAKYCGAEVK